MNALVRTFVLAVAFVVGGCASMPVFNFKKADSSGVDQGRVAMVLIGPFPKPVGDIADPSGFFGLLAADSVLSAITRQHCGFPTAELSKSMAARLAEFRGQYLVAPALVPVIAAVGSLLFTQYVDSLLKKAEELKAAALPDPEVARLVMMGRDFNRAKCVAFVRYAAPREAAAESNPDPQPARLVVVLRLVPAVDSPGGRNAFVLRPVYARALDSVAITTASPKDGGSPRIALAAALSVKEVATSTNPDHVPGVFAGSQAAVRIQRLVLGKDGTSRCNEAPKQEAALTKDDPPPCVDSDVLARPSDDRVASISMSVSEVGDVGFDIDLAQAELKAIRDAMGPAIDAAISKRLGQ